VGHAACIGEMKNAYTIAGWNTWREETTL